MIDFTGGLTLPATRHSYPLTDSDDDLTDGSYGLLAAGSIMGEFRTGTVTSGTLTTHSITLSGTFGTAKNFTGSLALPHIRSNHFLTSATFDELNTPTFTLVTAPNLFGTFTINHKFSGALTTAHTTLAGAFVEENFEFSGALVLPRFELSATRTGRSRRTVIFMNENVRQFSNESLNSYIDDHFTPIGTGTGTIEGSGAFDPSNMIIGGPVQDNDTPGQRSVTMRAPNLGNKQRPTIEPEIYITMSGDFKTYVDVIQYDFTLSWKLLNCDDILATRFIALLYFDTIRYVIGDDTWKLVLLDDVQRITQEARKRQTITLNFKGVRIT